MSDQGGDQLRVPLGTDHPTQPQPTRDGQGHGLPGALADQLDPQLVGLDVLEVDLPLLHQVLVHLLAVLPSPLQPGGHRPLIQQEGGHTGLHGDSPN